MMLKKFNVLSSYAIAATVTLFAALINGCDRREEVYPVEGNAYMNDPAFKARLKSQVAERDAIAKTQRQLRSELERLRKQYNGDNVAVTNSAEGAALYAKLIANEALFASNRMATAGIMRERIQRATADSERIARGEAKAIDISKKKEEK